MTLKVTSSNSHVKQGASILCLALFGLSFLLAGPFLFSSSLPSSNATSAAQLSISVAPSLLNASLGFKALMSVQLLSTSNQFPVAVTSPVQVILTSNNTNVATPSAPLLNITSGSYATENLVAGGTAGVANISASAPGYVPTWFIVNARIPITTLIGQGLEGKKMKDFIVPYFAPSEIASNNQNYLNMVIGELETLNLTSGIYYPELAPANVMVWGRSSNNGTMSVSTAPYIIPVGGVYAMFNLTSTYFPGFANITLQANNWNPLTTGFYSYGNGQSPPPPQTPYFSVQNTITPSKVLPGESFNVLVLAQTVNAPISSAGANVTWSSKGANLTSSMSNLNSTGYGSATFIASKQSGLDNITVSIKEGGITPYLDNITVDAYLNNMTVSVFNPHPSIVTSYTTTFTLRAIFNNTGVANASITWLVNNGTLISPPSKTNATGYALVTYESGSKAGNIAIEANVSKVGYTNVTQDVNFAIAQRVTQVQNPTGNGNLLFTKIGNILPLWALIPIIAGAGVGGFFVIRKYRGGEVGYYDDEE